MLFAGFLLLFPILLLCSILNKICIQSSKNTSPRQIPYGFQGFPGIGILALLKGPSCRQKLVEIKEKYGPICQVRLGSFNCVWLNDYHLIKKAWYSPSFCGRPALPGVSLRSNGFRGGIIFNDGPSFTEQRRFVVSNLKSLGLGKSSSETFILEECHNLVANLETMSNSQISTRHLFNISAFNIIWKLVTGGEGFSQDDPSLRRLVTILNRNMELGQGALAAFWMPWLSRWFPKLVGWHQYKKDATEIFQFWQTFARNTVKNPQYQDGLLAKYLARIEDCSDPNSSFWGDVGIMSLGTVLQDLFIAGSETTASTLQWICLYLSVFPLCQDKIVQEIATENPNDSDVGLEARSRFPYTEAFIRETLRYSTLAPLGMVHETTKDAILGDYLIKKRTLIQMNMCAVHFDSKYWTNPLAFQPERFLREDGTLKQEEIPGFLPFSWGQRMCPGAELAKQTLFLVTIAILRKFEIKYVGHTVDLRAKVGVSAVPYPHNLIFKPRETKEKTDK